MKQKQSLMIFATITMLTTLLVPMFLMQITQAADPSGWYKTVDGVLDTDYYTLYPYETDKNLKIGFSKFGELINSEDNVGLEYGAVDPFAPAAGSAVASSVPKRMWLQGWLINITYTHRTKGERNVWATALHGDGTDYGKDWIRVDFWNDDDEWWDSYGVEDPRDPGYLIYGPDPYGSSLEYGGRKTNGTAVTEDIEVLYDGPREFIAVCRTTLYDHTVFESNSTTSDIALVEIAITIRFDKVKKEVTLLKDVKSLLVEKEGYLMKIEFSNRGEVDLGTEATGYSSYAHFYTDGITGEQPSEGQATVYNANWTLIKTEDPTEEDGYSGFSADGPYPQDTNATFDVAQAISSDKKYVWSASFWPSLSDWSIDGWNQWWHSLKAADPHYIDGSTTEPFIPFYIGEWDFILHHTLDIEGRTQFRGVTTYGIVDYHDASDSSLIIDSEVQYYLDEKFNPWDLYDAVHKKNTTRWYDTTTSTSYTFNPTALGTSYLWDQYSTFSEKITKGGVLLVRGTDYTLAPDGSGVSGMPIGTKEIRWSSNVWYETYDDTKFGPGRYEWIIVGRDAATIDSAGAALVAASLKQKNKTIGLAGADMFDTETANQMPYIMNKFGTGATMTDYKDTIGRAALNDNWCTYWPVASSNTLGVGGPLANMLSYYANDFTDAIYGLTEYAAGSVYDGKITGVTCWNRAWPGTDYRVYESSTTTGYAVISTYLDINGTVIFEVWGHWGRDTYYATQWLHGDAARNINPGILQLEESPRGLTSIILKINYGTDPDHPTFSIPELLGTISETEWIHTYTNIYTGCEETETKGGIHDP
ncbi:hypothetical protein D4R42_02335 [bacterium]|nr:MAG: hypothetical protein D4R42_02335 [bacterium]